MVVCHCKAVSDRIVGAAIDSGARTVEDVTAQCRAGGGCGGCHDVLQALIDAMLEEPGQTEATAA